MPKAKYYIFTESGDVVRTDDREVAEAYDDTGNDTVIDGDKGEFLSGVAIPEAEPLEEDED